ncbi:MAG: SO_0444 family Cu/Zn efflux transporter [Cocleimonas sp.]
MMNFLDNLLALSLEAAPWLVLGLVIGGLIKALIPTELLHKHLSGNGFPSIVKAALFGAPLPLCSCGVIPAALSLRKAGASKPATVSFLVSTPETGIDSVTISYALLGPFMAIVRPIAAIISAITAGLLVGKSEDKIERVQAALSTKPQAASEASCCASKPKPEVVEASCCSSKQAEPIPKEASLLQRAWEGIVYSFVDLFDKVLFWLCIGLVFAAGVKTFVPVSFLTEWGSGLPAMLVMLMVGIPMYVCAVASTPMAAGLLLAGVSPGTAMVFLMAGPATNISTLGVIGKELGRRSLIAYLTGVGVIALITGFVVDFLVDKLSIDVQAQIAHNHNMVPSIISWAALLLLLGVVIKLKSDKLFGLTTQAS